MKNEINGKIIFETKGIELVEAGGNYYLYYQDCIDKGGRYLALGKDVAIGIANKIIDCEKEKVVLVQT